MIRIIEDHQTGIYAHRILEDCEIGPRVTLFTGGKDKHQFPTPGSIQECMVDDFGNIIIQYVENGLLHFLITNSMDVEFD
jgi:hypothetical protein